MPPRSLPLRLVLLILWSALFAAPPASAQGGFAVQEFNSRGVRLPVPRDYDTVPVTPEESWMLVKWVHREDKLSELKKGENGNGRIRPWATLIWIDRQAVGTGEGSEPPPAEGETPEEDEPEGEQPETEEDPNEIRSFDDVLRVRFGGRWAVKRGTPGKLRRDGHTPISIEFEKGSEAPSNFAPWATVLDGPGHQLVLLGFCSDVDRKDQAKIWDQMAKKIEFFAAGDPDAAKWRRFYESRPKLIDPEYRILVRSRLVKGWMADDTENYIYVYSTKNEPLMRRIKIELEAIRTEYLKLFPPAAPITAVSTVRVCKDDAEYKAYGGPEGSGGYWNWRDQELVLYDYPDGEGEKKGTGKADTRIVLYHEGFHQYIYYSAGAISPHSWYNEGTGDFFSGAQVTANGVQRIGPNPWRLELIQRVINEGKYVPWKEIVRFEQPEYYAPGRIGICYAQGWSMIYFLRTCKDVEKNPAWAAILPTYFDVLKREYESRAAELEDPEDYGAKFVIEKASRDAAVEAAFKGIDYDAITQAWEKYILGLEAPR
jgi:hypothetical protein